MDDIIQKIIDFEKKAQAIVGEARDEKQEYEEIVRAEIEAYKTEINGERDADIKNRVADMNKLADETVKHLEDAAKLRIVQMHRIAESHKDEWIGHLYNKIIGGEIR